jgi:prepilin signal peptidase PulO-like enzyme (type II secretory pathway)
MYPAIIALILVIFLCTSYTDISTFTIPDCITFSAFLSGLIIYALIGFPDILVYSVSSVVTFLFLFIVRVICGGRLGWGDIKLSTVYAFLLLPQRWILGLFLACVLGVCYTALAAAFRRRSILDPIAFAPFLGAGVVIAALLPVELTL